PLGDGGEYVVKDPSTGAYCSLGEQEVFLLLRLDGRRSVTAIIVTGMSFFPSLILSSFLASCFFRPLDCLLVPPARFVLLTALRVGDGQKVPAEAVAALACPRVELADKRVPHQPAAPARAKASRACASGWSGFVRWLKGERSLGSSRRRRSLVR